MIKPIFVMLLNLATAKEGLDWKQISKEYTDFIRKSIGDDYHIIILPVAEQNTSVQIFYPGETTVVEYNDLLAELGKTTALNNIRINLASGEGD